MDAHEARRVLPEWLGAAEVSEVRRVLSIEAEKEGRTQGAGDVDLMRRIIVFLFALADPSDVPRIWLAKKTSMDAFAAIDVQFLCGPGLERAKQELSTCSEPAFAEALEYIGLCERAGDFDGFDAEEWATDALQYYLPPDA